MALGRRRTGHSGRTVPTRAYASSRVRHLLCSVSSCVTNMRTSLTRRMINTLSNTYRRVNPPVDRGACVPNCHTRRRLDERKPRTTIRSTLVASPWSRAPAAGGCAAFTRSRRGCLPGHRTHAALAARGVPSILSRPDESDTKVHRGRITKQPAMLRDGTPGCAAQPYQQLAMVHRAAGYERDVRRILMQQRQPAVLAGPSALPRAVRSAAGGAG